MKNIRFKFCLILLAFIINSCANKNMQKNKLLTGDLIFVQSNEQNLSGAISRVTKNNTTKLSYDHIGIVEKLKDSIFVLHSTTIGGSKKELLDSFVMAHQNKKLVIYRLKDKYQSAIPKAIIQAKKMLGKPYNYLYIPNDSSYYCSDFIYYAFRKDSIFKLEPMTFINPNTGITDNYWQTFYDKHKVEVPEGLPGCNPNGLSQSDKIHKLFILNE